MRGRGKFALDHSFVGLRKSGFGFDPQTSRVVEQLVYALVRDFSIQQFAYKTENQAATNKAFSMQRMFRVEH